jgi:hypothetical protein
VQVTSARDRLGALVADDSSQAVDHSLTPRLTEMEKQSALWKKLKAHMQARVDRHRASNDTSKSVEKTEKLRGRIAEAKYFLTFDTPAPGVDVED